MAVVSTLTPTWPLPRSGRWTVDDLDRLPDDGLRYELLDGTLLVTPAPVPLHQRAVGSVFFALRAQQPDSMEVFVAPLDWRPDLHTSLQPDVLVARNEDVGPKNVSAPLLLAVEVLSPTTRRTDLLLKRSRYVEAGIPSYWVVDPQVPSLTAFELVEGAYRVAVGARGNEIAELARPFPVRLSPADLVTR